MVAYCINPVPGVYPCAQCLINPDAALFNFAQVNMGITLFLRIRHLKHHAVRNKFPPVTYLAAGLGIKCCLVQYDTAGFTCLQFLYGFSLVKNCQYT